MGTVRATERLRLDPGEHRAINVVTTDANLLSQSWVPGLARVHIAVELVGAEELVHLATASDVVLLPMRLGAAEDSLLLVARTVDACRTPVVVAVERGCEEVAARAVDAGAAAYVFLPYRRPTMLRQFRRLAGQSARTSGGAALSAGQVVMDVRRREVTVDGLVAPMPPREFEVLRMLLERQGEVVPTRDLVTRVWGADGGTTKSLVLYVRRLRERLEVDPSRPTLLHTVRGTGYKLERTSPVDHHSSD